MREREPEEAADRSADPNGIEEADELRAILAEWIALNNARDVRGQMGLYPARLDRYYTLRGASRAQVRVDKERIVGQAREVNIEAGEPSISYSADGDTAILTFRKDYEIEGGPGERQGAVMQELRLRRNLVGEWKIVSERDLRVLRD